MDGSEKIQPQRRSYPLSALFLLVAAAGLLTSPIAMLVSAARDDTIAEYNAADSSIYILGGVIVGTFSVIAGAVIAFIYRGGVSSIFLGAFAGLLVGVAVGALAATPNTFLMQTLLVIGAATAVVLLTGVLGRARR